MGFIEFNDHGQFILRDFPTLESLPRLYTASAENLKFHLPGFVSKVAFRGKAVNLS